MNKNCPFKVGDTVRRVLGTSTDTKPGFQGEISRIRGCSGGGYDLHFTTGECGTYWIDRPDGWALVELNPVPTVESLFVEDGYSVHPASNGGFIVRKSNPDIGMVTDMAAFSNVTDMLGWLASAHGVKG